MLDLPYIKSNYLELMCELEDIARRVGVKSPTLVAVTKSGSDDELAALVRSGAVNIGENRPQELRRKADLLYGLGHTPTLHEIGTLQRKKVKMIIKDVALIHSLDSLRLADEIEKQAAAIGRHVPVLIEINSAKEENKSGILPSEAEELLCEVLKREHLEVRGLMTMGPADCEEGELRGYFRETKRLFDDLGSRYGFGDQPILSMGMSDSYRVAIEEGSTLVRVGRKLFRK